MKGPDVKRCEGYKQFVKIMGGSRGFSAAQIAALSYSVARPGAPARTDVIEVLRLLLAFGVDPGQRGINDYSALHICANYLR